MLGLLRLMLPKVLLPATTALGTIQENGRELGILAGANVVMPNLSPKTHRKDYSLYDNKLSDGEEAAEGKEKLEKRMEQSVIYILDTPRRFFEHFLINAVYKTCDNGGKKNV